MKVRVASSGEYVSLSRARWLVTARRARFLGTGELAILHGTAHAIPGAGGGTADETVVRWSAYSNVGLPNAARLSWLRGVRMNGAAMRSDER